MVAEVGTDKQRASHYLVYGFPWRQVETTSSPFPFCLRQYLSQRQSFILRNFLTKMIFRALLLAPLPLLALGAQIRRQDSATSSGATSAPPTTATAATSSAPSEVPFTLISSNPTAFPLSEIVASPATHTTIPLTDQITPGATPTIVATNAPPLPSGSLQFPLPGFTTTENFLAPRLFLDHGVAEPCR